MFFSQVPCPLGGGPFGASSTDLLSAAPATETVTVTANVGAAASGRRIVVAVTGDGFYGPPTSVVIGGVTATLHASGAWNNFGAFIASAVVPSGTTATIVINNASPVYASRIAVYRLVNAKPAPYDTMSAENDTSATLTGAIDIPPLGCLIAIRVNGNFTAGSMTWTGATEQFDAMEGYACMSGAFNASLAAQVNRTVTAAYSVSGGSRLGAGLCAVSWS